MKMVITPPQLHQHQLHQPVVMVKHSMSIHQILLKNYKKDYLPLINSLPDSLREYYINKRWRFVRSCSAALPAAVLEKLEATFGKPWLEAYASCAYFICS